MGQGQQVNGRKEAALQVEAGSAKPVGKIFGDVTTSRFRFLVEAEGVQATMYVAFAHEGQRFLAQVLRVDREAINGEGDRLVAEAQVIGRRNTQGRLTTPRTPPRPDAPVHRADPGLVRQALNLDDRGAYLGRLRGLDLEVRLDVNELVQKHCSILAKTGAGKSYALGVLMEELLKHEVPIVVIDPHGEHASLAAPNSSDRDLPLMRAFKVRPRSFAEQVVEYAADPEAIPEAIPYKLDGRNLTARDLSQLLGGDLTSAQTGVLHQAIRDLRDVGDYTLDDIIHAVEQQSGRTKWPVLEALEDLADLDLLSTDPTPVRALVQDGQATILNLKGAPPHVQDLVVAQVTTELFEARKVGLVDPHMCVLEEAHNFCPERNLQKAASGEILRTIASEGRKFGMGLAVISQRPAKIDKNVLSQCNTQIILKVTNKNDLRAISSSVEGLPPGMEDEIQALPVGTALVSEPTIAVPLFCEIRPRETRHGGTSMSVVKEEAEPAAARAPPAPALEPPEPEQTQLFEPAPSEVRDRDQTPSQPPEPPEASEPQDPEPRSEPTPGDLMAREVDRAEDALADVTLAALSDGDAEALLVEVEHLIEALAHMADRDDVDAAWLSGMEHRMLAHQRRLLDHLRQR
ncbi:MAG: ATP-binding protein [Candidatus Thermoplasmatota archaeon]|nr:ATP-binding protein [Candidatus Thermoplasmatota archaeon]